MQLTQGLKWCRTTIPTATATVFGERGKTWGQMADRVARLAAGLRKRGAGPHQRIAILALNSDRYIEILFAVAWAGCVSVPFNTRWSKPEILAAMADSEPGLVFLGKGLEHVADNFVTAGIGVIFVDEAKGGDTLEGIIAAEQPVTDHCGRGDALAAIFYTGGTTGRNKGVMLSHAGIISSALMLQARAPYATGTRFLFTPPLFHMAAAGTMFGVTMMGGTHIVLQEFEPAATLRVIEECRVTALVLVPTMIGMLCEELRSGPRDVSSVKRITYGASAISPAILKQAMHAFPHAEFVQGYGQTELSPTISLLTHEDHLSGRLMSAGRPLPLADIRIVDENMTPLEHGKVGEVVARGPNVMLGYWRQPELTEQTIVDGWLKTGDAGYKDEDGYLYLVDRVKDMIVSGGENIYSAEVEGVLMQHPDVIHCAVIGVPDDRWGERVHAVLYMREGSSGSETEMSAHCKALMASYKCPKSYDFWDKPLPLSGVGKILKAPLRKPFWDKRGRTIG